ncbi:hypothetical protein [Agarivorans sp. DSG3-1]|uniref:hypothetical protein n=1 Tax=Agarivorans sp. DSG3-1 TaxID=3342249 RepID=UPI00398EF2FD
MITTLELLEGIKARFNLPTDYKTAQYLGVTHQTVSGWRKGTSMSPAIGLRIAELLEMDVDYVHLCLLLEKAKDEREKASLQRMIA